MAYRDRGAHVVTDCLVVGLVAAHAALADDDQLLGGILRVVFQTGVRIVENHLRQLVGRHREGRDISRAQCLVGFLCGVFDVLGVVVAAVDDDQVLDATGDVQLAIDPYSEVTGVEPVGVVRSALGMRCRDA
ncbi:Uncharacterised protein [Mycobacteroides abscessus subsp. abscessus]|nr:Uncharacterised protein [Mycobacteroides abscessus subsp. abscessus]